MSARARRSGGDDQVDLTQGTAQSGIEFVASGSGSAERRGSGGSQVVVKVDAAAVDSVADTIKEYKDAVDALESGLSTQITDHELEALTRSTLRHVLFCNSFKEGGIISRNEVIQHINAASTAQRKGVPPLVIAKVQLALATLFGINMVELTKPPARKTGNDGAGTKYYALKSMIPKDLYQCTVGTFESTPTVSQKGLLGVIIALIKVSGGTIVEEELWRHLQSLGVEKGTKHPIFEAIPSDVVDEFVRRRYLKVEKMPSMDKDTRLYAVGENALHEISEDMVTQYVESELKE
ncbi:hypothetical protein M9435_000616 [Picochlorum sp. BPE23]|uniref:MAGE domain-containing protein n=1 Tax=Picochlorum oklahomense TaxID=249345 RepID=A0A7S1GHL6_9CHLO|nr:hypothetical protein M9435_000616 [Picochlorum sp. BPE23]|mmetsp:Transcript_112/g.243  ORF Transcript_112/g.243 Transcript_112/m.243 type:complete len:293 (+) Transcript_112:86-964(+)|eukprot:CAMPEP_0118803894 /NCGR_PEP_ID=MMETSP1161-20130426/19911_1 /TAXON_ID=249345 /ORGANISM="Picochlorum oklahomensis, Strain CCMP2329" /LENGTH=292 /DNA_ID=CAMNT_0006732505 /DNA_START=1 /DNA_END=879 /DNA_ORIENTATION=-